MHSTVERAMKRWGTALIYRRGKKEIPVRGFLQYVDSRSWQTMQKELSLLGEIPVGWYLYIGPPTPKPERGDTLVMGEKSYQLRRAEQAMLRDTPLYSWGLCVEEGSERDWGES